MLHSLSGKGCTVLQFGLPENFPAPSTERGKRRHAKRTADQRKHAESVWGRARSTRQSKYQKILNSSGGRI